MTGRLIDELYGLYQEPQDILLHLKSGDVIKACVSSIDFGHDEQPEGVDVELLACVSGADQLKHLLGKKCLVWIPEEDIECVEVA